MASNVQALVLPEPPSANRYWRSVVIGGRVRVLLSAEARAYRNAVVGAHFEQWEHRAGVRLIPFTGDVSVSIDWYRGRKSGDLDNRIKQVLDALKGLAYVDDKQVVSILAVRRDDKANPRAEVRVSEVSP